jgi:hypothetical protein
MNTCIRFAVLHFRDTTVAFKSQVLLQFLLDYPVGEKRIDSHLHFLLVNLAYEHETGRLAAAGALEAVVAKFPQPLLTARAELLFLPLVARLVNDPSSQCACYSPCGRLTESIDSSFRKRLAPSMRVLVTIDALSINLHAVAAACWRDKTATGLSS